MSIIIIIIILSSRGMTHREEWVVNIFIQHQYQVLSDTYRKTQCNKLQTINKRIYRNWGGSKFGMAKRSKISSNIKQLIKLMVFVAHPTKRTSVVQYWKEYWRLEETCCHLNSSKNDQLTLVWKTLKDWKNNIFLIFFMRLTSLDIKSPCTIIPVNNILYV